MNNVKIDAALHAEFGRLPALPFMRLVRQDRASLKAAREALARGEAPRFSYSKAAAVDVAAYQQQLAACRARIDALAPSAPVAELYHRKAAELAARAELIAAVQRGDDAQVHALGQQLYGPPSATLAELEAHLQTMLASAGPVKTTAKYWIDAPTFARMVRQLLDHYGLASWRVKLANRRTMQVSHSKRGHTPLVRIPKTLRISRRRARQLLAHEVEAHALRQANGAASPLHLLERGTAGYLLTDEGIAMHLQQAYAQTAYHWPGFWESYAVALAMQFDAPTVYRMLANARSALAARMRHHDPHTLGERAAWRLCLRIYRGFTRPDRPGLVFSRDHVYLSGFRALQGADLDALYVGHAALGDLPALAALGITPQRTPDRLAKHTVSDVLRQTKTQA